ncbi:MAG: phosphinothricin acetyltransferase [Yoonia sp.]|jgi:phosphinothricin acetyltransferase
MIRPANARDASDIAAIWNHAIRHTTITFNPVEKTVPEVAELMTHDAPCLVFTDGPRVLGFARYSQFRGGDGYRFSVEHTIMLHDDAHGKGAGRGLIDSLCTHAKDAGKHTMYAGVSAENQGAVDFHTKMGFTIAAVLPEVGHKFGRWLDLVLMQKRL